MSSPDNVENLELLGDVWLQGIGNNLANVLTGNDAPNAIFGGDGNDTINAGDGSDGAFGGNGDDSIHAGGGADKVYGGEGNDRLDGGEGNDILTGKTGSDAFIFSGSHGIDSVRDFDSTTDHLEIAGGFWALEMLDGTFDGVIDGRDANVFYGVPEKNDAYQPNYDGPPDETDAGGMNIITGIGIVHLDNVYVLTADDVWALT
jgi:Ca2+-binding RTX toxin-like protein